MRTRPSSTMPPHPVLETTLALLRAATEARSTGQAVRVAIADATVERVDWHAFVAFATSHFVLQALAGPLRSLAANAPVPTELVQFADDFSVANRTRNHGLAEALTDIAEALAQEGIRPVALKGAAYLLQANRQLIRPSTTATFDPVAWRFMRDLDLLIDASELATGVAALERLGFRAVADSYDAATEAHYPPLLSPCGTFSVELHTRLFGLGDFGIDLRRLVAAAQWPDRRAPGLGIAIGIPAMPDRIAHLLAHAQLHNRNFDARRLVLKDVLDLAMLPRDAVATFEANQLTSVFVEPRQARAARALLSAWRRAVGVASPETVDDLKAEHWAATSLKRLTWPVWRSLACLPYDLATLELARLLHEPGHIGRRFRLATTPTRLADAASVWAFKQRQRLWS